MSSSSSHSHHPAGAIAQLEEATDEDVIVARSGKLNAEAAWSGEDVPKPIERFDL